MSEVDVIVNVYDLSENNKYTYPIGLGIFHSGVEIFDTEFSFGGHEFDLSGIFQVQPRTGPAGVVFRESILIAKISNTKPQVLQLIKEMSVEFTGRSYHMIHRNCNHFSNELVKRLCGKTIPGWINRMAVFGSYLPCVVPIDDWVNPPPAAALPSSPRQTSCPPPNKENNTSDNK